MKKVLILFIVLLSLPIAAQDAFRKGKIYADVQIGSGSLPRIIGGGVHYAVLPYLSVGTQFFYQDFVNDHKYVQSYTPALSADYHLGHLKTFDWYTGLSLGYHIWRSNDPYEGVRNTGCVIVAPEYDLPVRNHHKGNFVAWNAHFGMRFFVYKFLGINGEIGFGNVSSMKIGLSVRI